MHESSLMIGLLKKITSIAIQERASKIVKIKVKLGALSNISADHFREHFVEASKDSIAEYADLFITEGTDVYEEGAQDILVQEVEVI